MYVADQIRLVEIFAVEYSHPLDVVEKMVGFAALYREATESIVDALLADNGPDLLAPGKMRDERLFEYLLLYLRQYKVTHAIAHFIGILFKNKRFSLVNATASKYPIIFEIERHFGRRLITSHIKNGFDHLKSVLPD